MSGYQWLVDYPADGGDVIQLAARDLKDGLSAMLGELVTAQVADLATATLVVSRCEGPGPAGAPRKKTHGRNSALGPDEFAWDWLQRSHTSGPPVEITSPPGELMITGGSERAAHAAAYELMERLGARFPISRGPSWPTIDPQRMRAIEPLQRSPAFARRTIASDLMTWHYETPTRLRSHLEGDRLLLRWMSARGLNAFSFIRHPLDRRLKIDELVPLCHERGIGCEYGGHVLPLLMPRGSFSTNPEFFPAASDGTRNLRGNLCVSNPQALRIVRDGALSYLEHNPECEMLHLWGADVRGGAWCRCPECALMSPPVQYMKVTNAIAGEVAGRNCRIPLAYLAYHDTIEPDPAMRPLPNVHFEWAPRERCYSHSICDSACEVNPRYFEMLRRYLDLFDGRGHVFEYYGDAILFGGIAAATPAVIAADLQAYQELGVAGISCLIFGMHSAMLCPVNLEAFARGTRNPRFEPDHVLADAASAIHPACGAQMAHAYRAIARASSLILDGGGDVIRPRLSGGPESRTARRNALRCAAAEIALALKAADGIVSEARDSLRDFERTTWHYSREVVLAIHDYIAAVDAPPSQRITFAEAAIRRLGAAIDQLRAAAPAISDTWAAYDLEWIRDIWLKRLRRHFDEFLFAND